MARRGTPGGPPVLALHGWLDNMESFAPMLPWLGDVDLVCVDLPGHGHTAHRVDPGAYHITDSVMWIHEVHAALKHVAHWGDAIHLLGHSLGGALSLVFAGIFPDLVKSLVVIESPGPLTVKAEDFAVRLARATSQLQTLAARQQQNRQQVYASPEIPTDARLGVTRMPRDGAAAIVERSLQKVEGGWTWRSDPRLRVDSPHRLDESQLESVMRRITAPCLFIDASEGLRLPGVDHRVRQSWVERGQVHQVPGGHHAHMEHPRLVAEAALKFILNCAE
jgi:pimeloyl-ACP methyl ester carboxylesterase